MQPNPIAFKKSGGGATHSTLFPFSNPWILHKITFFFFTFPNISFPHFSPYSPRFPPIPRPKLVGSVFGQSIRWELHLVLWPIVEFRAAAYTQAVLRQMLRPSQLFCMIFLKAWSGWSAVYPALFRILENTSIKDGIREKPCRKGRVKAGYQILLLQESPLYLEFPVGPLSPLSQHITVLYSLFTPETSIFTRRNKKTLKIKIISEKLHPIPRPSTFQYSISC